MVTPLPPSPIDAQLNFETPTAEPLPLRSEPTQSFGSKNILLTNIKVAGSPDQLAVNPLANMVYVTQECPNILSAINGTTNEITENINLGYSSPEDIAVNPVTNMVYVATEFSSCDEEDTPATLGFNETYFNVINVIDGNTNKLVANLTLDPSVGVQGITVNPVTNRIYLAEVLTHEETEEESYRIAVIDGYTDQRLYDIAVQQFSGQISVDSKRNLLYVPFNSEDEPEFDKVSVIDGSNDRVLKNITIPNGASEFDISPERNMVYAMNSEGNRIFVVNAATNETKIIANNYTFSSVAANKLAVDNSTNLVYALIDSAERDPNVSVVYVIDGNTNNIVNHFISEGRASWDLAVNPKTNMLYMLSARDNIVSVVNGKRDVILTDQRDSVGEGEPSGIKVEHNPQGVAVNPVTNRIYVTYSESNIVSVIDGYTDRIIDTITVGTGPPSAIDIDPTKNMIYLINSDYNTLFRVNGDTNDVISNISISGRPYDLAVNPTTNMIYTLDFEDDFQGTVSAINGTSKQEIDNVNVSYATTIALDVNTDKIYLPQNEESITVIPISDYNEDHFDDIFIDEMKGLASQEDIAINPNTNLLYVITDEGKRLSEIDSYTGIVLNDFGIPGFATDIAVNPESNVAYVTSQFSNTVSAINLTAGAGLANVTVDVNPQAVAINPETNKVYVANRDSSTVSVIDGHTNKAIAGATFKVNPSNSGYIQCAHSTSPSPTEQYIYVWSDHSCIATPNKGYEFVSWEQNLQGNSTQVIQASAYASIWDSILDFFGSKLEEPQATLNMSKFGNFTANFKEIPPPVSSEYLIPLYGIIITTIVGWSIPSIIGWTKSKRDVGKLNYYHKQITSLYGDGKLDENDIRALDRLRSNIVDAYSKGKLNEKHYDSLRNETSILYDKIFRKRIDDALNNNNDPSNNETMDEQFKKIRNDIKYAYSEGKINDKHYDLLNKDISDLQNKKE